MIISIIKTASLTMNSLTEDAFRETVPGACTTLKWPCATGSIKFIHPMDKSF